MKIYRIIVLSFISGFCLHTYAQKPELKDSISVKPKKIVYEAVQVGYHKAQSIEESTSATATINNKEFDKRSAKNIANSLFGHGLGLTVLQNSGRYADSEPTMYVRGLQTLSNNTPLVLVDGIERDITDISPEEVETVTILKDAAATAIYGYKGVNGVINISTKRGEYETTKVKASFEHAFDMQVRRPKFVNSFIYAKAMNEALTNDGYSGRYSQNELDALASGEYPYYYPDVDWIDETFRDLGYTNNYNVSFSGGTKRFRYYALTKLTANDGFIENHDTNSGYSTQDKYSRANLRTNMDVDLTETTKMKLDVLGVLSESKTPGADNLWSSIYVLPAAAFPVQLEDGTWGGNATWDEALNPVAGSQDAAYTKYHSRSFFADMTLSQDFSAITEGLGASVLLAYDNSATYTEDHTKTFAYGSQTVTEWGDNKPETISTYRGGVQSAMDDDTEITSFTRVFNFAATTYYDKAISDNQKLYAQLKWDYKYRNIRDVDQTWYTQNASLYAHYGLKDKYFADLTLVASGSNQLASNHKWALSPTISAAWLLSKEDFMQNLSWIDLLKVRASFGIINSDEIPGTDYWEQTYGGGGYYPFDTNYSVGTNSWSLGQLASLNSTHEKAFKYNFGIDAKMFDGLDFNLDTYFEHRTDIWIDSDGKYSSVLGFTAPYENGGVVNSWGIELGTKYNKTFGDVTVNFGVNFTLAKNKIKEQYEELRMYENLVTTNKPLKQTYGLVALGFFKDQSDIDNSPEQLFGDIKPGDIKYEDVNGDGQIDTNDKTAIGYSTTAPEIYYSFNLGVEWKGFGFDAVLQGVSRYSAMRNTTSVYWPLIDNTTISQEYYDNRWTPESDYAKYPRLTSQSNSNNFQTNTVWLEDRSFLKLRSVEVYYNLPQSLIRKVKFIKNAKFYVRGVDLVCFNKIKTVDPESLDAGYPLIKSFIAGVSIDF